MAGSEDADVLYNRLFYLIQQQEYEAILVLNLYDCQDVVIQRSEPTHRATDCDKPTCLPALRLLEVQALGSNLRLIVMGFQKSVAILQCYVAYIYSAPGPVPFR